MRSALFVFQFISKSWHESQNRIKRRVLRALSLVGKERFRKRVVLGEGMITVNRGDANNVRCHVDPITNRLAGFPSVGHNFRMPEPCALIGYENLKLHWDQALSELGCFTEQDAFYPYVVYQTAAFRRLEISGNCPVAERVAREIARCHAS